MDNALVYIGGKLLLSLPVGKRKGQLSYGRCPCILPLTGKIRPLLIFLQNADEPLFQLRSAVRTDKIPQFFRFHIAIGHTHLHLCAVMICSIHESIALRLRQMHIHRPLHFLQFPVGSLNLIYSHGFSVYYAVGPALYDQIIGRCIPHITHDHLCLIFRSHSTLYHTVYPSALCHCIVRCCLFPVVYTAAAQDKFHQIAHRYSYFHVKPSSLFVACKKNQKTPYKDSTHFFTGSQIHYALERQLTGHCKFSEVVFKFFIVPMAGYG